MEEWNMDTGGASGTGGSGAAAEGAYLKGFNTPDFAVQLTR